MAKRILSDGKVMDVFGPVKQKVEKKSSKWILSVKFNVPVPPMRFDTTAGKYHNLNGKQKNYGFSLLNTKGEDIIGKEPYIKEGNTIIVECSENPGNAKLSYALNGHYGGGNLCDSQNISINNKNTDYANDNFCLAFRNYIIVNSSKSN